MALFKSAFLSKLRGSVGNVTFVPYVEGETIMKEKISNPTVPNTAAQVAQKTTFKATQRLASILLGLIQFAFLSSNVRHTNYAAFMSENLKRVATAGATTVAAAARVVQMTSGSLFKVPFSVTDPSITFTAGSPVDVDITWPYDSNASNQDGDDAMYQVAVNSAGETYSLQPTGDNRGDAGTTLSLPSSATDDLVITTFFVSQSTGQVSSETPLLVVKANGTIEVL